MKQSKRDAAVPLARYLGARLRAWRDAHGLRQEELATAARRWGFEWTQATVAALETGRRQLSSEELLALPWIASGQGVEAVGRAHPAPVELAELLGEDTRMVQVTPTVALRARAVGAILSGRARRVEGTHVRAHFAYVGRGGLTFGGAAATAVRTDAGSLELEGVRERFARLTRADLAAADVDQHGEAERKAARRLRTFPLAVAAAARQRWGRSFTQERDSRVAEHQPADVPPARLQALRGHVARGLLDELREAGIEGWTPTGRKGRR